MRYKTKPVEIEAWEWNETREIFDILCIAGMKMMSYSGEADDINVVKDLRISTLEGTMHANKGDFIIKGLKGEFYPCKPEIFNMKYEPLPHTDK